MGEAIENNKRIAKNSALLYFRQILIIFVSLYTVRVMLEVLGVEDYGIYNVVGGIVTMFSFLSGTMSSASQRYFAFDLGRRDYNSLSKTFSLMVISYMGIALVVFAICECGGVWLLKHKISIPIERLPAAIWVLHATLISFVVTILNLPYIALLIARERMDAYAYITILEVGLKLFILYTLEWIDLDKLKAYALLTLCCTLLTTLTYRLYCKKHFKESHFKYYWQPKRLKEILSYAGWNMIGAMANIFRYQGINTMLGIFFNPAVNAARAVAYQINSAMLNLANNFFTAVRPQIIKRYSSGNIESMTNLILKSSVYAFYLLALFEIPIYFALEKILIIWIEEIPPYTTIFTRLFLITSLIEVFSYPLVTGIQATGKIKVYQLVVSIIYLLNIPIAYLLLRQGYPPQSTMIVSLLLTIVSFIPRLLIAKKIVGISIREYLQEVISRAAKLLLVLVLVSYIITRYISSELIVYCPTYMVLACMAIYFLGLQNRERSLLHQFIISYVQKLTTNKE